MAHYDLALAFDPATGALQGRAAIRVAHTGTDTVLPLALEGLAVDSVYVDGRPVQAHRSSSGLSVMLPAEEGTSVVEVSYGGIPTVGLYRDTYEGQRVIYTDSWPDRGRGWFPAVHHPSDPATLSLALELPLGFEAVGSGVPAGLDTLGNTVRYRWSLNASAPTYTYAFAVSDFSPTIRAAGDTLPLPYYMLAVDSADYVALRRTPLALDYFADILGPYPFGQYATVQVPIGYAGMENASAPFLKAGLFDEGAVEKTQVHEAAHQWFGNRVVIADWRDLWISEGMATYLTTLFYEHVDGRGTARQQWADLAELSPQKLAAHTALAPPGPVDPNAFLTWVPYEKGASVLHLLRLKLGDAAFFNTLRAAYEQYAGRPLSTEAYLDLFEQYGDVDLDRFAGYWIYGTSLPVLDVNWDASTGRLSWAIREDAGTLSGVPFMLEIRRNGRTRYVPARQGHILLADAPSEVPSIRPVGVLMRVE